MEPDMTRSMWMPAQSAASQCWISVIIPRARSSLFWAWDGLGAAIKEQADPFGLITRYHNRRPLPAGQAAGAEYDSFERLLAESDIISINVPLNAHTRGLIGAGEIARIKGGVNVVNTARGVTIDEAAMAEALDLGKIAAVGLNAYELMVPHLGTHTVETLAKMETCATENARRVAVGEPLLTPVPKHIHSSRGGICLMLACINREKDTSSAARRR
ncbi:D-isomer specific 2-hydroxyacid dehydrogenase [Aspergillus alliaceus]|uniref:D-isomer specific 2-hydroxyacid dehydrogenase n=1 Tax=Petromyces alliaceus TaxID=209559 RepID=UPI0012A76CBF|nr:D-isomer specific 2-hydroxyacid dehydrogenase [Aspergillus alliaceus]KAB8232879.1 D-isomer specific 2-hydroxyacid dehydrogenase [Aspergillus alliaceus]